MNEEEFAERNRDHIRTMQRDTELQRLSRAWFDRASRHEYSYHFTWLGRPVIQFPADLIALQEVIWSVKPRAIIETGIARGGSLIFHASMLQLLDGDGIVVGVDVDIRPHNRNAVEAHPLSSRIRVIQGSSVDQDVVATVRSQVQDRTPVMVVLDSNHTHEHVLRELRLYAPLVTMGSYLVVLDTVIDDLPGDLSSGRPWGKGNNPRTALQEFLASTDRFVRDDELGGKLLATVAPDGYLRCIKE